MKFNEKLKKLRTEQNLTQEELAGKLFVSRTAISKWESGRGYPGIDSLKVISKYFHVTIDELICSEEIVTLAENEKKETNKKITSLICSILDCLMILLFILPVFGNSAAEGISSVALFELDGISGWLKIIFISIAGLSVLNGSCGIVMSNYDKPLWNKFLLITGIITSLSGTVLFILARQPYAGMICLFILVMKGFFMLKSA